MNSSSPARPVPILLNPAAGGGSAGRRWPDLEACLRSERFDFTLHRTGGPGDGIALARSLGSEADRLIVVGGDGTVNEAVNGLMQLREAGAAPPAFGVIPATTGNDFARSIGMPLRAAGAVRAIVRSRPRPVDIGRVDYAVDGRPAVRYFALACHTGLAAEVGDRANRSSKRWGGTATYASILVRMVFAYRGCRLVARSGGAVVWDGPCLAAVVANGERLGGGMKMAPGARTDDGVLDFIGFGDFPLHLRLLHLPRIFPGTHLRVLGVRHEAVREIELEADRPTLLDVDGETIGELPARVSIVPAALRVLLPE